MLAVASSEIENFRARTIAIDSLSTFKPPWTSVIKRIRHNVIMTLQNWVFELAIRFTCIVSNEAVVQ